MKKIDVSGWKKFKIEDVFMIKKPDVRSEKYRKTEEKCLGRCRKH